MTVKMDQKSYVEISSDAMHAYLFLQAKPEGDSYIMEDLLSLLSLNGVKMGIDESVLLKMIQDQSYLELIQVASGKEAVDGIDGYFDFQFDTDLDRRPKQCQDGSVDYWNLHVIEQVVKGQVVANYTPAVPGVNGYTVKGMPLMAKRSRDKRQLRGSGFERSNDDLSYISTMDGKIEYKNEKLTISNVYEVFGNVDLSIGNIDFPGDVAIHGNVCRGVTIKASGNIIIDGIVEASDLYANKDIILRGGMLGGNKAKVFAKGNICARFFEYTNVEARGTIQADVFMDSQVYCEDHIVLSGKKGSVIGGKIIAIQGIKVNQIGNMNEVKTEVHVGISAEIIRDLKSLEHKIVETKQMLEKIEAGITILANKTNKKGYKKSDLDEQYKMKLLREKIAQIAVVSEAQEKVKKLNKLIESAVGARIRVCGGIYPGVQLYIDESKKNIRSEEYKVEYFRAIDKLIALPIED